MGSGVGGVANFVGSFGQCVGRRSSFVPDGEIRLERVASDLIYQLGWTTLPGLKGLSVSEFRAMPTETPDNERGVAIEFADDAERTAFLQKVEAAFAARRFTNAADAFDTVKAYVIERAAKRL